MKSLPSRTDFQNATTRNMTRFMWDLATTVHQECRPLVIPYVETLQKFMEYTGDGKKFFFEGQNRPLVWIDNNGHETASILSFIEDLTKDEQVKILWVQRDEIPQANSRRERIVIGFCRKDEIIKATAKYTSSIVSNMTIQNGIPEHNIAFDRRIFDEYLTEFDGIFNEFNKAEKEWEALKKEEARLKREEHKKASEKRLRENEERLRAWEESVRKQKEAARARHEAYLLRRVEKRLRRHNGRQDDFYLSHSGTPVTKDYLNDVDTSLRTAKQQDLRVNSAHQVIKAIQAYAEFINRTLYMEDIKRVLP